MTDRLQVEAPDSAPRTSVRAAEPTALDSLRPEREERSVLPRADAIVDDQSPSITPGQMRRGEFLTTLEQAVSAASEAGLSRVGRTARDCPFIRYMFDFYRGRDADQLRRAIARHAPETKWAMSADEYIALVSERARRAVDVWASTGRIEWQSRDFAAPDDPRAVQAELDPGRPLESAIRGKAQSIFQEEFSTVRVHTDSAAAATNRRFGTRAFAVGEDIAFAPGEYQPGTRTGDAIIAHELAHVVQQRSGSGSQPSRDASPALEQDANQAATGAVLRIWGSAKRAVTDGTRQVKPALQSGLRIQGCKNDELRFSSSDFEFTVTPGPMAMTNSTDTVPRCSGEDDASRGSGNPTLNVDVGDVKSKGFVQVSGGTDALASDWRAGYIQTVTAMNRVGHYQDAAGNPTKKLVVSVHEGPPKRDGARGFSALEPWYNTRDSLSPPLKTPAQHLLKHYDRPCQPFPWRTPDGTLYKTSGGDSFCTWLIVYQTSTKKPIPLNWATWETNYDGAATVASMSNGSGTPGGSGSAGSGAKVLQQGDATKVPAPVEPVLQGPIATLDGNFV